MESTPGCLRRYFKIWVTMGDRGQACLKGWLGDTERKNVERMAFEMGENVRDAALCDYNDDTTSPNNLVLKGEGEKNVSRN